MAHLAPLSNDDIEDAFILERARKHNIASFVVPYGPFIQAYRQDPAQVALPDDFDISEMLAKQPLRRPRSVREPLEQSGLFSAAMKTSPLLASGRSHTAPSWFLPMDS